MGRQEEDIKGCMGNNFPKEVPTGIPMARSPLALGSQV